MGLTKKQKSQIREKLQRKKKTPTVVMPATLPAVEAAYFRKLKQLVRSIDTYYQNNVEPEVKEVSEEQELAKVQLKDGQMTAPDFGNAELNNAFRGLQRHTVNLNKQAKRIATIYVKQAEQRYRALWVRKVKATIGVNLQNIIDQSGARKEMNQAIRENVKLIKSLTTTQVDRLEESLNYYTEDRSLRRTILEAMKAERQEITRVTISRAKLISRDQTSKFIGNLNQVRQTEVGVTHYFWRTSGDSAVRPTHQDNNGKKFAWVDPPAETGHPGQDVQCRCQAEADLTPLLLMAA